MRGLSIILLLFYNKFNEFITTGAGMLDSIYHLTLNLFFNCVSGVKNLVFVTIM